MEIDLLNRILERLGGERRINYTLDRFTEALKSVGNPERAVHTIVIGGTNGKGTTSLLVSSALIHAGFKVVTYLSPHLQSPAERILEGLRPVDDPELGALAEDYLPVAEKFELSYFEFLTLLVLLWAKRSEANFLVLEVGLGGRLDATNVTRPLACAITNIAFDHQEYLGDTLEKILNEKLGILRSEGLLFTGIRDPHLLDLVEKRCLETDSVYYFSRELALVQKKVGWDGQEVTVGGFPFELTNPTVGAMENAALAFLLLRIVFPRLPISLFQKAFSKVKTPGRLEVVANQPRVVLSGDHNPAGIVCLEETLKSLGSPPLHIVCGFSPDKPYREMFASLQKLSKSIVLTSITRLKDKLPPDYHTVGPFVESPHEAVDQALKRAAAHETVLITGSLYLVGELRPRWKKSIEFLTS